MKSTKHSVQKAKQTSQNTVHKKPNKAKVGVDGLSVKDCMPYEYLLRDAIAGINKYISMLETLKSGHATALANFKKEIKVLRDNNYYCAAAAPIP